MKVSYIISVYNTAVDKLIRRLESIKNTVIVRGCGSQRLCPHPIAWAIMDADLQDPLSLLSSMIKIIETEDYGSVATSRVAKKVN